MSSYALTKSLTSLARCSCVFISDTCESLSLNRDHSAAPTCGMLLPPSIPCGNQQRVKMDCVCLLLPLPAFKHLFFFLKYSKDIFPPASLGWASWCRRDAWRDRSHFPAAAGVANWVGHVGTREQQQRQWGGTLGALYLLVLQCWSCRRWGSKLIHVPPQKRCVKPKLSPLCVR